MKKSLCILIALIILLGSLSVFAFAEGDGWYESDDGNRCYYENGEKIKDTVFYDSESEKNYYFDKSGVLAVDKWSKTETTEHGVKKTVWLYSLSDGSLATGWKKVGDAWYYLLPAMVSNGGYYVPESKKVYFFNSGGTLRTKTGWASYTVKYSDGTSHKYWSYLLSGGVCTLKWKKINNAWYYFDEGNGAMLDDGVYTLGGKVYCFNTDGKWNDSKSGFVKDYGKTYYFEKGFGATGWRSIYGKWYCFDVHDGHRYENGAFEVFKNAWDEKGVFYFFEKSGALTEKTGWIKITGKNFTHWYYVRSGGKAKTGWLNLNGKWYYLSPVNGIMYSDGTYKISGKEYFFNKNGVWIP